MLILTLREKAAVRNFSSRVIARATARARREGVPFIPDSNVPSYFSASPVNVKND
jgi:hypothetical protein